MISRCVFMPRRWAIDRRSRGTSVMVSITDPGSEPVTFAHSHHRILRVEFQDLSKPDSQASMFTAAHARSIIDLANFAQGLDDPVEFLVHCRAGQSRSAAVAQWVSQAYGVPVSGEPADIGFRLANEWVLSTLKKEAARLA